MENPVIVVIDDDQQVLRAVERDLRSRFGAAYRVIAADSGTAGLDIVRRLKLRGSAVALFIVDQRMPGMTGVEFLGEAREHYPDARRVLLTAYADTEVAIAAINSVHLDQYLLKPWDPPEEKLFPVLEDVLDDWTGDVPAALRRTPHRQPPAGRRAVTRSRTTWPGTRSPSAGWTSRSRARPPSWPRALASMLSPSPWSSSPTALICSRRPMRRSPNASGCALVPLCPITTCSSSAAGRPAWQRPSTAPRRASRRCSSSARRREARPAPPRASRTTWASRPGSPERTWRVAPWHRRCGWAPRSSPHGR